MEAIMDKIMSTRMDEAVIRHIDMLAKRLGISKKAVLEKAVRYYVEKVEAEQGFDVLTHTFGSWQRDKSTAEIVQTIKDTMRKSQERYKR
jgi:predicted transcriptional regulator